MVDGHWLRDWALCPPGTESGIWGATQEVARCGDLQRADLNDRVYKKNNRFPRNGIQQGSVSVSSWTLRELTSSLSDSDYKPVLCFGLWF